MWRSTFDLIQAKGKGVLKLRQTSLIIFGLLLENSLIMFESNYCTQFVYHLKKSSNSAAAGFEGAISDVVKATKGSSAGVAFGIYSWISKRLERGESNSAKGSFGESFFSYWRAELGFLGDRPNKSLNVPWDIIESLPRDGTGLMSPNSKSSS